MSTVSEYIAKRRLNISLNKDCPTSDKCEDALRKEAESLGIVLHHAHKTETIQKLIDEKKAELAENGEES